MRRILIGSFGAVTVGRGRNGVGVATIAPIDAGRGDRTPRRAPRSPRPGDARAVAAVLRHLGRLRRGALPAGAASAPARSGRRRACGFDHEDRDAAHVLVLGDEVPFDELELAVPANDEAGPGWRDDVSSRFGRYALRLWEALLALEQRSGL